MRWCEDQGVDYVLGLARNPRLQRQIADAMAEAELHWQSTGKDARVFTELVYCTTKASAVGAAWQPRPSTPPTKRITAFWLPHWSTPICGPCTKISSARGGMENRIE